jgi:hypothetical protein
LAEVGSDELQRLLRLAHAVVTWTGQDTLRRDAAGYRHLIGARQEYLRARIEAFGKVRALTPRDCDGCTCGGHEVRDDCMYHYAAALQPWNHRIPWNCPSYYDGCNCEGGPFYEAGAMPEGSDDDNLTVDPHAAQ